MCRRDGCVGGTWMQWLGRVGMNGGNEWVDRKGCIIIVEHRNLLHTSETTTDPAQLHTKEGTHSARQRKFNPTSPQASCCFFARCSLPHGRPWPPKCFMCAKYKPKTAMMIKATTPLVAWTERDLGGKRLAQLHDSIPGIIMQGVARRPAKYDVSDCISHVLAFLKRERERGARETGRGEKGGGVTRKEKTPPPLPLDALEL